MAWFSELISTAGRADIANGLADVSAKAALLLVAALLATYVLRRASASTRHHVWIVAFCSILALPAAMSDSAGRVRSEAAWPLSRISG